MTELRRAPKGRKVSVSGWLAGALALAAASAGSSAEFEQGEGGDANAGRAAFVAVGCAQCHGPQGEGTDAAPRLAPTALSLEEFREKLRFPINRMPEFGRGLVSDQAVADIHQYLRGVAGPGKS